MKKSQLHNNWFFLGFLLLAINLIQGGFTQLYDDEAYYWMFSKYLDWGYFDHPPMVALFIKIGYSIFQNELGVRLLTALSLVTTLRIIWQLIDLPKKQEYTWLFFLIAFSLPFFQIYGFITTPDVPLLLFGSLTLLAYRRFIHQAHFLNILLFAISSAALMYSKYHGGLLILLIICSNWRLLLQPKFYLVGLLSLTLYLPHMYWQYANDFSTFSYHVVGRVVRQHWWYIPEFFLNQILVFNPLLLLLFIPLIKNRTSTSSPNSFNRTLKFVLWGFPIFFFLISLQFRHIEPHWTLLSIIPLLIFTFEGIIKQPQLIPIAKKIGIASGIIFCLLRIQLIFSIIPNWSISQFSPQAAQEVAELSNGAPIIHLNSFQKSSLQAFHTPNTFSWGMTSIRTFRDNQFSYWNVGDTLNHKKVYFVDFAKPFNRSDTAKLSNDKAFYYRIDDDYQDITRVTITPEEPFPTVFKAGDTTQVTLSVYNPYEYSIKFDFLGLYYSIGKNRYRYQTKPMKKELENAWLKSNTTATFTSEIIIPEGFEGEWLLNFTLQRKTFPMMYHSKFIPITIE